MTNSFNLSATDLTRLYERSIDMVFGGEEEKRRLRKILVQQEKNLAAITS